jgi:hypothetical protein
MTLATELLLAILVFALYLNDAFILLAADEAILERGSTGKWTARFGTRRFTLLGRHVYLGGLLPPHTPVFKLAWAMEKDVAQAPGWEEYAQRLRPFEWAGASLFVLVIVLLPLALITRAGDSVLLGLIGLSYVGTSMLLVVLWVRRSHLGLSNTYCLKLGAEMLLCPPIAANVCRRLSLQQRVSEDFVSACRRLLAHDDWALTAERIAARIEDEMEAEGAGTRRYSQLTQRKGGLV